MSSRDLGQSGMVVYKSGATEYAPTSFFFKFFYVVALSFHGSITILFLLCSNRVFALDLLNLRFQLLFKKH